MKIGISQDRFWNMTPREMRFELDAYNFRKKQELEEHNLYAYLQGEYFLEALAVIASSFTKGQHHEYPNKPYDLSNSGKEVELTEEEKITRTKMLFASLETMQANFNNNHREKNKDMDQKP